MNGDNSLSDYTNIDINEMEMGIFDGVDIIVLQDRKAIGARILKVVKDDNPNSLNSIELTATINSKNFGPGVYPEVNMLDKNTLSGFIDYCILNFKADRYALVVWSHSDGWRTNKAITSDDDSAPATSFLSNSDIASVVATRPISVVSFDSCLEGTLENVWEFKKSGYNGILIASPNNVPGSGWNYYDFLKRFEESYKREFDFAQVAIESYKKTYSFYYNRVSLSAFYLPYLNQSVFSSFFTELKNNANTSGFFNDLSHTYWDTYEVWSFGAHIDFYESITRSNLSTKNSVLNNLKSFIIYSWDSVKGDSYKGISIIDAKSTTYYTYYTNNIGLASDTDWNEALSARSW